MAVEISPPQLARLLDTAERPRASGWSLRAALTRYAQPQPQRASEVIESLRRIEFALRPHAKLLEKQGDVVWRAVTGDGEHGRGAGEVLGFVVALLGTLVELDRLGDVLAEWAVDRASERPDALVDAVIARVNQHLHELGVPHEERPRPRGRT